MDEGVSTTDLKGRFEIRGLGPGSYGISAVGTTPWEPVDFMGRTRVEPDGAELQFRVDRSTLVVHLECPEGVEMPRDLRVAPLWEVGFHDRIGTDWEKWPDVWTLGLVQKTADSHGRWGSGSWHFVHGTHLGENVCVFDVEPGGVYDLGAVGPGQRWDPMEVRIPKVGGRVDVVKVVRGSVQGGWLELDLVDPWGEPYRDDALIRILDPATGVVIAERSVDSSTEWPWRLRMPEGEHRIVVDPRPHITGLGGSVIDKPARCSRYDGVVEIEPEQTLEFCSPLSVGARIQLTTEARQAWAESEYREVLCWIEVPGTWATPLEFLDPGLGRIPGAIGAENHRRIRLGHTATSELLPAGTFELVGFSLTGETVRIPIELTDGVTTEATLRFED